MLLAMDVGNTNISIGLFDDGRMVHTWRIATDRRKTDDEFEIIIHQLFDRAGIGLGDVTDVAIGTVVPSLRDVLSRVSRHLFGVEPWVLDSGKANSQVVLKVDRPEEVGADRIAASIGAYRRFGGPLIVIDFGTATTFDCMDEEGAYLGGAIAPGVEIAAEALFARTAKLPRVEYTAPPRVIGKNTVDSLRSGIIFGYVGMVEGIIRRMAKELGKASPTVVGTGGLCPTIAEHTEAIHHVIPTLVLEGLYALYQMDPRSTASGGNVP